MKIGDRVKVVQYVKDTKFKEGTPYVKVGEIGTIEDVDFWYGDFGVNLDKIKFNGELCYFSEEELELI